MFWQGLSSSIELPLDGNYCIVHRDLSWNEC